MGDDAEKTVKEIMDELFPAFEAMDARSAAIVQFLKEEGMATDDQLSRYLQPAEDASNVRWRAARIRLERLFSSALKTVQKAPDENAKTTEEKSSHGARDQGTETQPAEPVDNKDKPSVTKAGKEHAGDAERGDGKHEATSGSKPTEFEKKSTGTKSDEEKTEGAAPDNNKSRSMSDGAKGEDDDA
jgi:hypothetical protein